MFSETSSVKRTVTNWEVVRGAPSFTIRSQCVSNHSIHSRQSHCRSQSSSHRLPIHIHIHIHIHFHFHSRIRIQSRSSSDTISQLFRTYTETVATWLNNESSDPGTLSPFLALHCHTFQFATLFHPCFGRLALFSADSLFSLIAGARLFFLAFSELWTFSFTDHVPQRADSFDAGWG
jgi:hypothetical protein